MTNARRQLEKLHSLVDEIREGNAFYRDRLDGLSLDSLEHFSATCALTDKAMLVRDREQHPPWGTNLTYPIERYTRFVQTSGTTGVPMAWLDTCESWASMLECWKVVYENAGVLPGRDRLFFAFSFGPFLGFWTAFEAAAKMKIMAIPSGGMSSAARLEAMARYGVTGLCCTPTYGLRLGELREKMAKAERPENVRRILVAGEPGGSIPATRQRIEELWPGARVLDHHGLTEVGPVSFEDPQETGKLCIIEDSYYAEVLDPGTLQEVAAGQTGELVLTTLDRKSCPLLRYRTGDHVRKGVGSDGSLALEGGILGRVDDMVVVRGVNLYPGAIEGVIRRFGDISEYRVVQRTRDSMAEVMLQVELRSKSEMPENEILDALQTSLRDAFGLRIPVKTVAPDTLPRFEFKARRWIQET